MFIAITTPQNPLRLENFLRPYKRGEQQFTPEAAQQILESTNHKKNIYDTLQLIASLPQEEQTQYKEIILSTFDHREQPTDTILLGKKLAASHSFENELNTLLNITPVYVSAAIQPKNVITCSDENPNLADFPEDAVIIFANDKVDLSGMLKCGSDNAPLKSVKFKEGTKLNLSNNECLPENLDVYILKCDEVDLSHSALRYYHSGATQYFQYSLLTFKEGSRVNLQDCRLLSQKLDVSKCADVNLSNTDLSRINTIVCSGNANFENATLPACKLDISKCDTVNLKNLKVSPYNQAPNIVFKNKQQLKESGFTAPDEWHGKIQYVDNHSSPISQKLRNFFGR